MIRSRYRWHLLAASAAALVLGIGALFLVGGDNGDEGSGTLQSFYYEMRLQANEDDILDTIRAWYRAPDHWRYDFGHSDPRRVLKGGVQVSDGERIWFYGTETNTYTVHELEEFLAAYAGEDAVMPPPLAMSVLVGPLSAGGREAFFDAWSEVWLEPRQTRGDDIAGRPTDLFEIETRDGSDLKLWFDRERDFILRFEASVARGDAGHGEISAEVIDIEFDTSLPDDRFTFVAPIGAEEVQSPVSGSGTSSGSSTVGGSLAAPPGFFTPAYVPDGYGVTGTGGGTSPVDGSESSFELRLQPEGQRGGETDALVIEQQKRAGGLAGVQLPGEPVSIGGAEGYRQTSAGVTRLVWAQDDVVLTVSSEALAFDVLLAVAESMR